MIIFHYATGSFFPPASVACAGNHVLRWELAPWAHAQEAGFTRSRAWTSLQDQSREYVSLKRSAAAKAAQCCRARLDGTRIEVARTCLLHRATDPRELPCTTRSRYNVSLKLPDAAKVAQSCRAHPGRPRTTGRSRPHTGQDRTHRALLPVLKHLGQGHIRHCTPGWKRYRSRPLAAVD
jgi:hypothetical protein